MAANMDLKMLKRRANSPLSKVTTQLFSESVIRHGFLSRKGGVSTGVYESLNSCNRIKEDAENVRTNLGIVASDFGVDFNCLKLLNQVHSNIAVFIDDHNVDATSFNADAIVTNRKGLLIGVNTADCTPILFADMKNGVVAAAHAGWRGALAGVIENTINLMIEKGAKRDQIIAVIGPTIAQESYEVDDKFKAEFKAKQEHSEKFFSESYRPLHHKFDLPGFCLDVLNQEKIKDALNLEINTYTNPDDYFSCRRSSHNGESDFGGQLSVIMLV